MFGFFLALLLTSPPAYGIEVPNEEDLPPRPEDDVGVISLNLGTGSNGTQWHLKAVDNEYDFSDRANYSVTIAILDTGVNRTSDLSCHDFLFWILV